MEFSGGLVKRMQDYFAERHRKSITSEEADAYLGSLARVYTVFAEIRNEKKKMTRGGPSIRGKRITPSLTTRPYGNVVKVFSSEKKRSTSGL